MLEKNRKSTDTRSLHSTNKNANPQLVGVLYKALLMARAESNHRHKNFQSSFLRHSATAGLEARRQRSEQYFT